MLGLFFPLRYSDRFCEKGHYKILEAQLRGLGGVINRSSMISFGRLNFTSKRSKNPAWPRMGTTLGASLNPA